MSFVYWLPNADGDWSNPNDWSGGTLPGSGDNVTISTSTLHTIAHSSGNDTIATLSVGNDVLDLDGGSLTVDGAVSMASGFIQQAGSLFTTGTVSVTGTAQLLGGQLGENAIFEATGLVTLANYTLSGNAQLINSNMVDETGSITLSSGGTASAIVNEAAGVFDITAGVAISNGSTPVSSFSNAGTLEMTATNNVTSHIYVDLTSTGLITAIAGSSLEIDGPSNSISGNIAGIGEVSFGGGTTTMASGTTISVGTLGIYNNGTNVTVAGAETLAGTISLSGGSTLTLDGDMTASGLSDVGAADILLGSHTLTIQGNASFEQSNGSPLIAGSGKLVTQGTTTLINNGGPALVLGGSVGWINSGTVIQNQSLQIGTASGSAAAVTNQAGGVFDVALGGIAISNGSSPVSKFSNAGTLEMTATNTVTSRVYTNLTSTGLITVVAGSTLEIDGPANAISGTITGTGEVSFGAGSTTIAKNTSIGVATLGIYGSDTNVSFVSAETLGGSLTLGGSSTLTLGGNTTVAGGFSDVGATNVLLGSHTLTLQGNAVFEQSYGSPVIAGTGGLVTRGTTTLVNNGYPAVVLGGSLAWDNYGTVVQDQGLQVGTPSGSAVTVVNEAKATFDVAVTGIGINDGSAPISTFSNAGTLEMTASNTGTSYMRTDLLSTGVISVTTGSNLEIDGPANSIAGTVKGAGLVSLGAGTTTIAGNTAISVATLQIYNNGTVVGIAGDDTVSGGFLMGGGASFLLGGNTLTLAGAASFYATNEVPLIAGPGRLVTQGTTTISGGGYPALAIGSGVIWENAGTVNDSQNFQIGNSTSSAATLVNDSGAVFNITAYNLTISNGSTPASTFSNAGTLEMTNTSNQTSYIATDLVSTGVITTVAGSNLEIDGPVNAISGTITGAGHASFGAGTTTIVGSTTISVATLQIYDNGTVVGIGGDDTVSGGFLMGGGASFLLGGNTLTLAGAASFYATNEVPLIAGPGRLVTQGTTTISGGGYPALAIGSGVIWENAGTVNDSQNFQIGNSTSSAATLVNDSGAVFNITAYNLTISNGSTPASTFSNAGTLEMTNTSNQTSYIATDLVSTGVITTVAGSNLEIDGPVNAISGTITGAGHASFGAGTTTIAGSTTISVATLQIYDNGTVVGIGGDDTVSGGFLMGGGASFLLGGNTLTLAGAASFYATNEVPLIAGPGRLVTQGTTTISGGGYPALAIGSGVIWENAGTVNDSQNFQIGNSTSSAATLVNDSGAVFNITAYNLTISNGSTPASTFSNAGTLEMTNTSNRTSYIATDLVNTGVISSVAGSNIELDGKVNSISGTIIGAGQVSFGGGTTTIAGGTSISVGTLGLLNAGTDLTLGGNVTVSGAFNDSNATTISLAGYTLTLAAAAVFNQYSATPLISGHGTLVTQGATSVGGNGTGLTLGSTATWNNFGMVTDRQSIQFGDGTNGAAAVDNEHGGVFDIVVNGVALSNGNTLASTFTNAGLLEMTVSGGASLAANVTNTGTVLAQGGSLALSGAVTGKGLLEVQSNGALGFSNTVQSTQTAKFLDTTGRLNITLPSANAFAAEITGFVAGDTIDLTNISNATGAFSAGVLTFTDNTSHAIVATLNFANSPAFVFAGDGHGGTLISATSTRALELGPVPQAMRFIGPQFAAVAVPLPTLSNFAGQTSVSAMFGDVPAAVRASDALVLSSADQVGKPDLFAGLHGQVFHASAPALSWYASTWHHH